jgi:hypothetical protein
VMPCEWITKRNKQTESRRILKSKTPLKTDQT